MFEMYHSRKLKKCNFVINIFAGADGQQYVGYMSNETKQCSVSDVSMMCDVKCDCSNEMFSILVNQSGDQPTLSSRRGLVRADGAEAPKCSVL